MTNRKRVFWATTALFSGLLVAGAASAQSTGTVAAEDNQQLTLRLVNQDRIVTKSEILSREKSPISMMPEGLLKTLKDDEVRDLIAYLRTTSLVPLPKP